MESYSIDGAPSRQVIPAQPQVLHKTDAGIVVYDPYKGVYPILTRNTETFNWNKAFPLFLLFLFGCLVLLTTIVVIHYPNWVEDNKNHRDYLLEQEKLNNEYEDKKFKQVKDNPQAYKWKQCQNSWLPTFWCLSSIKEGNSHETEEDKPKGKESGNGDPENHEYDTQKPEEGSSQTQDQSQDGKGPTHEERRRYAKEECKHYWFPSLHKECWEDGRYTDEL